MVELALRNYQCQFLSFYCHYIITPYSTDVGAKLLWILYANDLRNHGSSPESMQKYSLYYGKTRHFTENMWMNYLVLEH